MGFIKNYQELAYTQERKIVLDLIETGLSSIQPQNVMDKNFVLAENKLKILDNEFNLQNFERIFLVGFGKGSATISKTIENVLEKKLTKGFVIDTNKEEFKKIEFTQGTHPLPSEQNINFTKRVVNELNSLTSKDLVLVIICGGGSAMFELPFKITLDKLIDVNHSLLKNGADIFETNTIRKHLSSVKGGGLAKLLYPAKVISLIFSDVAGNNLSTIASGTTVKDETNIKDALAVIEKYKMKDLDLKSEDYTETPKEKNIFENVKNILMLSNETALLAMSDKAKSLGINCKIFSDKFQSEARNAPAILLKEAEENSVLLAGGETTVKVKNLKGEGGRNQEVALSAISEIDERTVIAAFDSDGWDNSEATGAIVDSNSLQNANKQNLNPEEYLNTNNSLVFFQKLGDAIITGRLSSNVSDLFIVYKK
ncbi:MAG: hypothetical protein A3B38_00715 [Candidatus Levybacteria bacterium RIFCSPLOWO2_01_FULL_36_13]|nr:MAG: hypothetical protein A2684_01955 [Candidatus Levybacteria bacterium RIFCSPHIGHO2_01_FULL_36_15b]OGH35410.1 MAG: hypothetical protein A3B38_00715 [Candidatus Levybacteria bacterium RIFCSPLOWO2_01_FULL_36_13]